jgi:RNA polymerase sigma-70 factor (ECF subfamily)
MTSTPVSLLRRLQAAAGPGDWGRFAELYTPLLLYWGRQLRLQEADAADLAQDVLTRVWHELGSYQVRPGTRFRGWLWTVTRNRQRELARKKWPDQAAGENEWIDPADAVGAMAEDEYRTYLVNRALELMRSEFEPATWRACWAFAVEGRPAADVAAELGITPNAVYLAKARVLRRLRAELDGLLE